METPGVPPEPISVLYVDDESSLLEVTKIYMEQTGNFVVDTSTSAQEAIGKLGDARYDAIVSDYQMPGMDGLEFLKYLRLHFGELPFILFTGKGREEIVIEALNNGANFYLQKGGQPKAQFAELNHKILQAVNRRRAEIDLKRKHDELDAAYRRQKETEEELHRRLDELAVSRKILEESEERYRKLVDLSPDMITIAQEGKFLYVNPAFVRMLGGTSASQFVGVEVMKFIHPGDRERLAGEIRTQMDTGAASALMESRMIRLDGSVLNVEAASAPIIYNGSPALLAYIRNITGRKTELCEPPLLSG